jgi:segregation and condensation protein A
VLTDVEDDLEGGLPPKMPQATDMNLEKLVAFPTWREMLLDLVHTQQMDPWNIDVAEIASKYLERIKNLEIRDLRMPANLILAASILLRFKSDALRFEDEQVITPEVFVGEDEAPVEIPMIELRSRIPPRRQVTLDELMAAMEKVFEEQQKREDKAARKMADIPPAMNISIPEFDIEQEMLELYDRVEGNADKEGLVLFSALADMANPAEVVYTLLPVLHLVQEKRISIFQEEFFGEIFVRLIPGRRPPPKQQVTRGQTKLPVEGAVLVWQKENEGNGKEMKKKADVASEKGKMRHMKGEGSRMAQEGSLEFGDAMAMEKMAGMQGGERNAASAPRAYAPSADAAGFAAGYSDEDDRWYFTVIPAPKEIVMWVPIAGETGILPKRKAERKIVVEKIKKTKKAKGKIPVKKNIPKARKKAKKKSR